MAELSLHPFAEYSLTSLGETKDFAHFIASLVKKGDYIQLSGELGAGKTSFVRFFVQSLMGDDQHDVTSPTFALVHYYPIKLAGLSCQLAHADLYRLGEAAEIFELDLHQAQKEGILCIEWAEKAEAFLPLPTIHLKFFYPAIEDTTFETSRIVKVFLRDNLKSQWYKASCSRWS